MAKRKKRTDGRLQKSFTYDGKRYYVYGKTAAELLENEVAKRKQLEQGEQDLYDPTLNSYYEHFTSIRRAELKGSTMRTQQCQFKGIADVEIVPGKTFGSMRIKEIGRRDIEIVREMMQAAGKTPQNLNICFAHLNHVFASAVLDDTIEKNPCRALKPLKRDKPPARETKHRALTEEETRRFFEAAEGSFYLNAFLLMIKTGMRIGELAALYVTDIDTKNGFIHVRRTITRTEAGTYTVGADVKTKSGVRDIPLTDEAWRIIKAQEQLNRLVFGFKTEGMLFPSSEGHILREYTINREIARICKRVGIEAFTCHAFRATFATRFIEQRPQDYKVLSEILGHKDVWITLNLYTHTMTDTKVRAMQELMIKTS